MISINRKRTKNVLLIFLILIVLILVGLTFYYSGYIEVFRNIVNGEKTKKDIIYGISINDVELNYDSVTSTYYLPINLNQNEETKIKIKINSSYNLNSKIDDREFKKEIEISEVIDYNKAYKIDVETWLYKNSYFIKFTNLPSISLNFNENKIGFEYTYSEFSITDPSYKENNSKYQYFDDAEVRYRGGSTAGYPKKGYRIKLEKNVDFGFLGMTTSKTWILDGLVTDPSSLRTKVASDIWNIMNEDLSEEKHEDLRSEFVELYVNGEYVGLYLLKETIDENLLNLDKDTGVLIKGVNWNQVDFNNYSNVESETFGPFEMKYPESKKQYPEAWRNILDKMKSYYNGDISYEALEKEFYVENSINHKIYVLITQALDNYEFKNIYYSIKNDNEDTKVLITPWDVDLTFGMLWSNEESKYTEQYDRVGEIVEGYSRPYNKTVGYYKDRWNLLIKKALNKEEINKLIDEQYEYIKIANSLERENTRNSNIEIKSNVNEQQEIQELKDWYNKRFDVINNYINSLQ